MKTNPNGKRATRVVAALLAVCCLLSVAPTLAACSRAPKADDLRETVVDLVEASYEINEVFLGAGLPVLDRDEPAYADLYTYYAPATVRTYDIVDTDHAKFASIDAIKSAASLVYSPDLLENNLYQNAFVGYAIEGGVASEGAAVDARFLEDGEFFYQSRDRDRVSDPSLRAQLTRRDLLNGRMRLYDYDTLRVVRPSTAKAVYVTMNSWYADRPDLIEVKRLRLVLTPSGWRLDSFTV